MRSLLTVMALAAAVLVSAFLAGAAASTGAAPSWVNTGPEGGDLGGYYEALAIHPKSPRVVYASSYNGLFRSTDGGATWRRRPAPAPWLWQVALDPTDPQTLYALASGALYRTADAGASWVELPRPPTDVHLNLILVTVSPSAPQTIYLVSYSGGVSGSGDDPGVPVFSSADAGRTWVEAGRIEAVGRYQPAAILVDPRSPRTVYVWVWLKGIFRSEDGGTTWTRASAGLPIAKLSSLAAHPTRSGVLYAGSERGGVFRSLDAGRTWRAVARGLDGDVTDLAVSGADEAVYAGTSPPYREDRVERGGGIVYRSADGRAPWRARSDGLTGWSVSALAAHPSRLGTVLAGTEHGIFGTGNGGASWVERVTGLVASSPSGLAVDPATAGTVFAAVERGVAVSRDGGRTWGTAFDLRRERAEVGPLLAVPGTPVTLYAVKRSDAPPKPRSILLTSHDAGRSWVEVGALPHSGEAVSALVGDPSDATTLYLVSRGIFRSVDAGRTWTRIYSAVGKPPASALAVDPFHSSVLYAVVRGRLRTSENGGRTWRELPGIPKAGIWQFALDPHRRGTVYAVTGGWVPEVYVSRNGGRTWSKLGKSYNAGTLLVDPVRPGVVYVGTERGVYVKRPGTATWQSVGPAGRLVGRLATDANGRRLYAGIEGGGVAATRLPLPAVSVRRSAVSSVSTSQPWDLVYIGDSSGWGVARFYARQIREDRGVTVRVHDQWQGDLAAATILERLRTPGDSWIRLIREAEVIVVYGNFTGLGIRGVDNCVPIEGIGYRAPPAIGPRYWQPYVATLKAIYKRIFELRKGEPVILRTATWYIPMVSHAPDSPGFAHTSWEEAGIVDACTRWAESWSAAIARAAAPYRIPVADVYSAFNGPDHREDPFAKGYLQADGIHPSNAGRAVIAKTLAELGYRQVKPPR